MTTRTPRQPARAGSLRSAADQPPEPIRVVIAEDRAELIGAIETVASGGAVIDPLIVDVLIEARSRVAHSRLTQLTPRERELLAELAVGKTNGAIAKSLFLTKRAVEKHVNSIFSKLGLPESDDISRRVMATLIYLSEEEGEPPQ